MDSIVQSLVKEASVSKSGGEFALPQELVPISATDNLNILGMLSGGIKRIIAGAKRVAKDKKQLVPVLILALTWILLTFLPAIGINPLPVKILSYLTFARGGIDGNILNRIGGIVLKGLFAYLLSAFVSDKSSFSTIKSGFTSLKNNIKGKNSSGSVLFFGIGIALVAYNLMVTYTTWQNTVAGIVCFALSLRTLAKGNGFAYRFFSLLISKIKLMKSSEINKLITGWTLGFGLGLIVSFIPISFGGYLFGGFAIIAAVILFVVEKSKQGVKNHE